MMAGGGRPLKTKQKMERAPEKKRGRKEGRGPARKKTISFFVKIRFT